MQHCIVIVLCRKARFYLSISLINGNIIKERKESPRRYIVSNHTLNK